MNTNAFTLHHGKSQDVLKDYPDNHFDSVVCDPPYHLTSIVKRFGKSGSAPTQFGTDGAYSRASRGFMGKEWDGGDIAFRPEFWAEIFRVLKPGGHLLAFSGSRTYHRMAVGIEDAGFEIRDAMKWIYLSGFPKSHDVSKQLDKMSGHWRGRAGAAHDNDTKRSFGQNYERTDKGEPITAAAAWSGWGTALKPSFEPICVARKPLSEGSVASNVLKHGTGAINVDGCRIPTDDEWQGREMPDAQDGVTWGGSLNTSSSSSHPAGRWPANTITTDIPEWWTPYFYCAKASKEDRDEGLDGFDFKVAGGMSGRQDGRQDGSLEGSVVMGRNTHPTVKPTDLMRYLCRLITPPGGTVLDPFMGSGSTGKAAMLEGFRFVGIDMTEEYISIATARIQHAHDQRNNLEALISKEAAHSPQMSLFDAIAAAKLPLKGSEE